MMTIPNVTDSLPAASVFTDPEPAVSSDTVLPNKLFEETITPFVPVVSFNGVAITPETSFETFTKAADLLPPLPPLGLESTTSSPSSSNQSEDSYSLASPASSLALAAGSESLLSSEPKLPSPEKPLSLRVAVLTPPQNYRSLKTELQSLYLELQDLKEKLKKIESQNLSSLAASAEREALNQKIEPLEKTIKDKCAFLLIPLESLAIVKTAMACPTPPSFARSPSSAATPATSSTSELILPPAVGSLHSPENSYLKKYSNRSL